MLFTIKGKKVWKELLQGDAVWNSLARNLQNQSGARGEALVYSKSPIK